jgi:LuxR family maltose regulon positive regulatory protein
MASQRSHQQCTALQKLQLVGGYRLVLIVAPSGAGKTDLLQQWCQIVLATSLIPPLYFDLKAQHNRPKLFLAGLLSELGIWDHHITNLIILAPEIVKVAPSGNIATSKSSTDLSPAFEGVIIKLINTLIPLEGDRFLILDNYQIIHEPDVHGIVAYLIDYLPPNFHLIITSQVNPPLQIPRLRARRELLEINPEDMI